MLNFLTKSTIRRKILLLFVYNQEKDFYLSEIARHVKTSAGTAQRELNRLKAMDFLIFKKMGNLSLYRLNPNNPLLREIEAIVRKTVGVEVELKKALQKVKHISFAFIFGSYAAGGMTSHSDIDLFLIGQPDEDDVYQAVKTVEVQVHREIQYHIASKEEFAEKAGRESFVRNAAAHPLMILGKEDDLREIIDQA